ncbi:MAG: DUF1697 domain-containing protein [Pseudomonadota bacterium]
MPVFVAMLRGVHGGKARRLPGSVLRGLLAGLGFTGVRVLLNSGNAVFFASGGEPAEHAASIAAALVPALGSEVSVVVKTGAELRAAYAENPHVAVDSSCLLVVFAQEQADLRALESLRPNVATPEHLHLGARAAFLHCPAGIADSAAARALLDEPRVAARDHATVLRLVAMVSEVAGHGKVGAG